MWLTYLTKSIPVPEDRDQLFPSPERPRNIFGLSNARRRAMKSSHVVDLPHEVNPCTLARYWFRAPASRSNVLRHFPSRGFWIQGIPHLLQCWESPSTGFSSTPEYDPRTPASEDRYRLIVRFRSLEVSVPHSATQRPRATAPGYSISRVLLLSSRLPCVSTLCSLDHLPDISQPGALTGFSLQSMTWRRLCRLVDSHLPSCDSLARPGIPAETAEWIFHPVRVSLQGFQPFAGWDVRHGFPRPTDILALLGFRLLGAFPIPSLDPTCYRRGLLSGTSGKIPF